MDLPTNNIVHVKGLTAEITIEDINDTFSKSGKIERIILGQGEALIFFADEDDAESSLVYDTIGETPVNCEVTSVSTIDNVVKDIDYTAKQNQEELPKQNQQQAQQKEEEDQKQDSLLNDVEIVMNNQVEKITQEIVQQEPQLDQAAQPEVHQPVPEVQPSQSFTPASPFKASIDPSPRAEEAKVTQIPTAIVETPVVNVAVPEVKQEEVVVESAGTPSVAAVATPTVKASDVPTIVPEVAPVCNAPAAVNVQATTAPSFSPFMDNSTILGSASTEGESTKTTATQESVTPVVAAPVAVASAPVAAAQTPVQPTQSACPFKSCSSAAPSKESSCSSETSSTLDSVQLLKALKNTTLPERTVPSQNDIFRCVGNKNFLIGLFGILIAVTFSSAL